MEPTPLDRFMEINGLTDQQLADFWGCSVMNVRNIRKGKYRLVGEKFTTLMDSDNGWDKNVLFEYYPDKVVTQSLRKENYSLQLANKSLREERDSLKNEIARLNEELDRFRRVIDRLTDK